MFGGTSFRRFHDIPGELIDQRDSQNSHGIRHFLFTRLPYRTKWSTTRCISNFSPSDRDIRCHRCRDDVARVIIAITAAVAVGDHDVVAAVAVGVPFIG